MAWTPKQEEAINEYGKNIIVSAGAGSGKTAVLSERVLTHIKRGIHIDELLILTFTNAAAAEMKERIRKKLIENNFIDEANKIDTAYITTFDSLSLSILKKYSYMLNLSKNINIIDNSIITLKKEEILNKIFEEYYNKEDELFLKLIKDYSLKDDKEIFNSILSLDKELSNLYNKENYLKNYVDRYYREDNINNLVEEYLSILINKLDQIKELLDSIKHYLDDKNYNKLYDGYSNLINSKTYTDIKFNAANLETIRLMGISDEAKLIRAEIKKVIDDIAKLTNYNNIEEIKNSIYSTKDYITIIIEILLRFNREVTTYKYNISSFEFVDISLMAIKILQDNIGIREELKNHYKEILIDEYQDTNDLQDIFISMIENNNCYMVGDIKQSIYRFRNANPALFKKKYKEYNESERDLKIDLNKNFRSRDKVLNNINLMFNQIMDENIGGASYFDSHQMEFGLTKYLDVNKENYDMEFLNYVKDKEDKKFTKTEIEIFTIIRDIKNKIDNKYEVMDKESNQKRVVTYSDFAILLDRSKNFNLYKKIFEYFNVPLNVYKDENISSSIDIALIKNIFKLLILIKNKDYSTEFKYAFASVSRSYLFELTDEEIIKYFINKNYYESELYKILNDIVLDIDSLSIKEIFDLIIDKFDIYNKLIKVGDINKHIVILDYLKNVITSLEDMNYTYINFYEYLDSILEKELDISLSLNNDSSNSVKIMTIHASKGLEFPICYFSGLYEPFNISDLKSKITHSNQYGFISLYNDNNTLKNNIVKELLKNNYIKEEISEKLRLLYVALTRAREKMIFVGTFEDNILAYKENAVVNNNVRLSYRSFIDILNSIYPSIKKYISNIDINELNLTKDYNYQRSDKLLLEKSSPLIVNEIDTTYEVIEKKRLSKNTHELYSKDIKNNIDLGLRMHYILEVTDFNNPNVDILKPLEKELLQKFLDTKVFVGAKDIYKELEFSYLEDDILINGIIDLLLVFDNKNIIVDYKLKNVVDDNYIKQLEGYKKYISMINDNVTEMYLYSIMDGTLTKLK